MASLASLSLLFTLPTMPLQGNYVWHDYMGKIIQCDDFENQM